MSMVCLALSHRCQTEVGTVATVCGPASRSRRISKPSFFLPRVLSALRHARLATMVGAIQKVSWVRDQGTTTIDRLHTFRRLLVPLGTNALADALPLGLAEHRKKLSRFKGG